MGPGERNIQHELRRQAVQVSIPTDMWDNISGRLDVKRVRAQRQQQVTLRGAQWKPALALAAAAGMLWLTVAPSGSTPEPRAATESTAHPVVDSSAWEHDTLSVRRYRHAGHDGDGKQPEPPPSSADQPLTVRSRTIAIR